MFNLMYNWFRSCSVRTAFCPRKVLIKHVNSIKRPSAVDLQTILETDVEM